VTPDRPGRDPRRSLALGAAIAFVVLALLAAVVFYGIYYTFSVRQDRSGLGPSGDSRFGFGQVAAPGRLTNST
jgi:hypothetical protein